MFKIYESVIINKTGKLGVVQGIMPRINKSKGFKYYVITEHGKRFYKESELTKKQKEVKMKKQLKDCTIKEAIDHFHLKSPFYFLSISDKGAALNNGKVVISFGLDQELNIDEVEEPHDPKKEA